MVFNSLLNPHLLKTASSNCPIVFHCAGCLFTVAILLLAELSICQPKIAKIDFYFLKRFQSRFFLAAEDARRNPMIGFKSKYLQSHVERID